MKGGGGGAAAGIFLDGSGEWLTAVSMVGCTAAVFSCGESAGTVLFVVCCHASFNGMKVWVLSGEMKVARVVCVSEVVRWLLLQDAGSYWFGFHMCWKIRQRIFVGYAGQLHIDFGMTSMVRGRELGNDWMILELFPYPDP